MNLHHMLEARAAAGKPLRVALLGAGKFGSMFLSQVRVTPGMHLVAVADLSPDRARAAVATTGWPAERVDARSCADAMKRGVTHVTDDAFALIRAAEVEIVIDATGKESWWRLDRILRGYGHDYLQQAKEVRDDIGELLKADRKTDRLDPSERDKAGQRFTRHEYADAPGMPFWRIIAKE